MDEGYTPQQSCGLNLRRASLHAPAAFLASSYQAQPLVKQIVGLSSGLSPHSAPTVVALATVAARPDWLCLEDIDIPLHQHHLSNAVDEAIYHQLISSSPSTHSQALALSSSLPHAGNWLNVVPSTSLGLHLQDCEFRCCLRYWLGSLSTITPTPALNVMAQQIPSGITKWGVEVMATG